MIFDTIIAHPALGSIHHQRSPFSEDSDIHRPELFISYPCKVEQRLLYKHPQNEKEDKKMGQK